MSVLLCLWFIIQSTITENFSEGFRLCAGSGWLYSSHFDAYIAGKESSKNKFKIREYIMLIKKKQIKLKKKIWSIGENTGESL